MRIASVLISAVHLIVFIFTFVLGLVFLILPKAPLISSFLSDVLINSPEVFYKVGSITLVVSIFLFFCFYAIHKNQYIKIKMSPFNSSVNSKIISEYIQQYFRETHPQEVISSQVLFSNQKIEIIADIPYFLAKQNKKLFLNQTKEDISKILQKHLNYDKSFILTLLYK